MWAVHLLRVIKSVVRLCTGKPAPTWLEPQVLGPLAAKVGDRYVQDILDENRERALEVLGRSTEELADVFDPPEEAEEE